MKFRVLPILALPVLLVAGACSSNSSGRPGDNPGAAAKGHGYERGQIVRITGVASDPANRPVAELEVVLEASRHSFDYLRFRKRRPVIRRVSTVTSADGAFEIQWPWDQGFNRFELLFGITVTESGGEDFHILHREDLTRRIEYGSPVVSSVQIGDTAFLDSFLEFRDSLTSEAQREVYRETGKPDKVRERGSAGGTEVDWWYFELGKVYRFRDGELQEVESFEPVRPLDS